MKADNFCISIPISMANLSLKPTPFYSIGAFYWIDRGSQASRENKG
jgi:hypothetical protein